MRSIIRVMRTHQYKSRNEREKEKINKLARVKDYLIINY
jgi:hypothetical protein